MQASADFAPTQPIAGVLTFHPAHTLSLDGYGFTDVPEPTTLTGLPSTGATPRH
ncbi:hypothetical protein ACFQ9Z_35955 [Streptomyces sp. NPDC056580]|uniref:hypothetical protein n=1 Tax=Streptomyces sp. NPDC056580 TaxID=3345872 RepID=UPI0036C6F8D1